MRLPLDVTVFVFVLVVCVSADLPCNPPCVNGDCEANHGELSCRCKSNWFGENCSVSICEAGPSPCMNGGTCVMDPTDISVYLCACPLHYLGDHCQYRANDASCLSSDICGSRGVCYGSTKGPVCICREGTYGPECQFNGSDVCSVHQQCYGNGNCSYNSLGNIICNCDSSYTPLSNCEYLDPRLDMCRLDPCNNGGTCTPTGPYDYTCSCPPTYDGKNCTTFFNVCANACQNDGICTSTHDEHYFSCSCPNNYTGERCDVALTPTTLPCPMLTEYCPPDLCLNNGTCVVNTFNFSSFFECSCPLGFTGVRCETETTPCEKNPCSGHTREPHCINLGLPLVEYMCVCQNGWGGPTCEVELNSCPTPVEECPIHTECLALANNSHCDLQCNNISCGYDGYDCIGGFDPWKDCSLPECTQHYRDGYCNVECNTLECLYDGGDCFPPFVEGVCDLCSGGVENGKCQWDCLTPQCPYDYQDCYSLLNNFVKNRLVLILYSEGNRTFTTPWREEFLGNLSRITNSIAVLEDFQQLTPQELERHVLHIQPPPVGDALLIYQVTVRLDIGQCRDGCVTNADDAVKLIYAYIASGYSNVGPYGVGEAKAMDDPPASAKVTYWYYVFVGIAVLLVALSVAAVIVLLGKRRRLRAKIWRPTSPSSEGEHASPSASGGHSGGTVTGTELSQTLESEDYIEKGTKKSKMISGNGHVEWTDDTVPLNSSSSMSVEPNHVVIGQQGCDARQWGITHTRDVGKLVQQYKRQNGTSLNVNTPGPGGFTPLMLAVMRRPGSYGCHFNYQSRSSSESSSDDQTALIPPGSSCATPRHLVIPPLDSSVSALIEAKATIDAVNDYNQSALYLAAACSRATYVDQLLEAGANPNIQDNWGQNALHTAIGAGAEGAFMVLLNCPRTKINMKSDGGITPLMSAVKMVNSFMVKQLLKKDSEIISTTDNDGRTAVHWAAMVDNLDALRMLVSRGPDTIKDAQDNKGQTALFLACREGSVMCVKHLIDCFANVTLFDNLDQSPLQIAMEKQYGDIVDLLRASAHGPLPYMHRMPANTAAGYSLSTEMSPYPQPPQQLVTPPTSKKKKSKGTGSTHGGGKLLNGQASYSTSSQLHNEPFAMTSMAHRNIPSSNHSSFGPTHPSHFPTSNYAPTSSTHSPPLPPHSSTSMASHEHYCNPAPTDPMASAAGYSPPTYDPHQQVHINDDLPPSTSVSHTSGSSSLRHHYPMYHSVADVGTGTHPLHHLPVVTEAEMQTSFGPNPSSVALTSDHTQFMQNTNSPPQSGGTHQQKSPLSVFHSSPNSNSYGTSPQSLTPSPDSQGTNVLNALGTVHVEGGYTYNHYNLHQQIVSSTPV